MSLKGGGLREPSLTEGALAPPEFGGSEKNQSITINLPGFENTTTALKWEGEFKSGPYP